MKIYIRTDSSEQIGTGHIMRCLTLADELRGKGAIVNFICYDLPGSMVGFINQSGYNVHTLSYPLLEDEAIASHYEHVKRFWKVDAEQTEAILAAADEIDWLIIDHYSIDKQWESYVLGHAKQMMVIDDMADREHVCSILLDQNYSLNYNHYDGLVPEHCVKLLGPQYALLRPQFREMRKTLRERSGEVRRILVFMGGTDPSNETGKALEAIKLLNRPGINVDVVLGEAAPHKENIMNLCLSMSNVVFYCQVENIAQLMADADLAIGASGSATWERCCLGLPSIVSVIADNQISIAEALEKEKVVLNLGWHHDVNVADIHKALINMIGDQNKRKTMSFRGQRIVDGIGASIVANEILKAKNSA
jgi:UDP-2,4-diacetamido-2,4,6-trideoxy-beta-L-altropyranose hydrolase